MITKIKLSSALFAIALGLGLEANAQTKDVVLTDVNPIKNSLSSIAQLEPLTFKYSQENVKKFNLPSGTQYGFNPEALQRVVPAAVKTQRKMVPAGKNAFKTASLNKVELEALIPILVGSIKEQQQQIESLKAEVRSLRSLSAVADSDDSKN